MDLLTLILEYIMSIIRDASEVDICAPWVTCVNCLSLYIKPVLITHKTAPENVINREQRF